MNTLADPATLDRWVDQRVWARDMDAALARYADCSAHLRATLPLQTGLAYGPDDAQRLDWFAPAGGGTPAPIVLYLHGGAWRSGSPQTNSLAAGTVLGAGAHFVIPGFGLCPHTSLADMARQVREAIAWVHREAPRFGADGQRIVLAAHSSGSHLLALALGADWAGEHGINPACLRAALCSSGFYDLLPVVRTQRNAYLQLDEVQALRLSPLYATRPVACPVLVAVAEHDSPLLHQQADDYARLLARQGRLLGRLTGIGLDHFEIAETYAQPDGVLGQALLGLLRQRCGWPAVPQPVNEPHTA